MKIEIGEKQEDKQVKFFIQVVDSLEHETCHWSFTDCAGYLMIDRIDGIRAVRITNNIWEAQPFQSPEKINNFIESNEGLFRELIADKYYWRIVEYKKVITTEFQAIDDWTNNIREEKE